ncbi:MAG: hypothetical protein LBI58_03895 [Tannerellaceae bacterium]|jgi:hypothetical protein|nr:hypothetical protein [Tannerellaceae bacterium]
MKYLFRILSVFMSVWLYGCLDNPELPGGIINGGAPEITSDSIMRVSANSIDAYAVISRHNGSQATKYGFYVSREDGSEKKVFVAPTAPVDNGKVAYNVTITELKPNTTYIIRAFAENKLGEGLGLEHKRTTTNGLGSIITLRADSIKGTSVMAGGHIIEKGEGGILERGIFRSRQADMSIKDTIHSPFSVDSFVFKVTGLDTMSTYYVQAFVRNGFGYFRGDTVSFTTKDGKPEFEHFTILEWQFIDASYSAGLSSGGDTPVTSKGVCWSDSRLPTTDDHVSVNPAGGFEGIMSDLTPFTKYYARAFATNSFGTAYSSVAEFTTRNNQPVVVSTDVFSISNGSAGVVGEVLSAGMGSITAAGFCWSTSRNPTVLNNYKEFSNNEGPFRGYISGLRGGTTYYAKAFALNSNGQTAYGAELEIVTPPVFTSVAGFPGNPRIPNSPSSFVIGNTAYLVGGDKGLENTNELWAYYVNQWNPLVAIPGTAKKWRTAVAVTDVAYVFGGLDASNNRTNEMYSYLPNQNRWEAVTTVNTPDPLHSATGVAIGNSAGSNAYFIGGMRDTIVGEVWNFNTFTRAWEAKTAFPVRQYGGIAVTADGMVYAGLGLSNTSGTVSNKKLWASASLDSWVEETTMPASSGHVRGGVAYKGSIYVVDHTGRIWEYALADKTWTGKSMLPSSNTGDSQHCMFVLNDNIYIGLGVSQNSLLRYDPGWDN